MNSKHSFRKHQPNSLLRQVFIEFSEATKKPARLQNDDGKYYLTIGVNDTKIYDSEDEVVTYMRKEIGLVSGKN